MNLNSNSGTANLHIFHSSLTLYKLMVMMIRQSVPHTEKLTKFSWFYIKWFDFYELLFYQHEWSWSNVNSELIWNWFANGKGFKLNWINDNTFPIICNWLILLLAIKSIYSPNSPNWQNLYSGSSDSYLVKFDGCETEILPKFIHKKKPVQMHVLCCLHTTHT